MEEEYKTFLEEMAEKGIEVDFDQLRFNDLSVNPFTGEIDEKSIFEAQGGLQGESIAMFTNILRRAKPDVKLDFEANDPKTGKTIFVDMKGSIDFQTLADEGKDICQAI